MDAGDLIRAAQAELLALDLDPDDLAALRKSMSDIRVALVVDIVGMDELGAYELAKTQACRLWAWPDLTEPRLDADEPEEIEGGVLRVGVLVGVTELPPIEAVRGACAVLENLSWSPPSTRTIAAHQAAYWTAVPRPSSGCVRIEVHAAPGLATITERRRQEMLADPAFAYMHDILRMP
ncbi:MAG: hypothetical protein H0W01_07680 [Pseudonocardiales bacterium]|jgi:hypothetical protein|nr:hypothetical protein [Pseudonocardiales bacterium]